MPWKQSNFTDHFISRTNHTLDAWGGVSALHAAFPVVLCGRISGTCVTTETSAIYCRGFIMAAHLHSASGRDSHDCLR
jgi:hypothetical protein